MGIFQSVSSTQQQMCDLIKFAEIGNVAGFKEMLLCALPVNSNGTDGRSALCAAIENKQREIFDVIVEIDGIDFNKQCEPSGCTALMLAARLNEADMVCVLLRKGARATSTDTDHGWTALHHAAYTGSAEAAKALLRRPVLFRSYSGSVEADGAMECGSSSGGDAAGRNDIINIDAVDNFGQTALHVACYQGHRQVVQVLIAHGCDLDVYDLDEATAADYCDYETGRKDTGGDDTCGSDIDGGDGAASIRDLLLLARETQLLAAAQAADDEGKGDETEVRLLGGGGGVTAV